MKASGDREITKRILLEQETGDEYDFDFGGMPVPPPRNQPPNARPPIPEGQRLYEVAVVYSIAAGEFGQELGIFHDEALASLNELDLDGVPAHVDDVTPYASQTLVHVEAVFIVVAEDEDYAKWYVQDILPSIISENQPHVHRVRELTDEDQ